MGGQVNPAPGGGYDVERGEGERFLVTGAHGCIGAWVVWCLLEEGVPVVAFDASEDDRRLRLLLGDEQLARLTTVRGDITQLGELEATLDDHGITNVVHLAALQVPFCRTNPPLGAAVNVVGTVNLLEALADRAERMAPFVYASSIAAYDALDDGPAGEAPRMAGVPSTLYGVYKRANEGAATVYWQDRGVASLGLRPHTVYGPGRDQGLTSAPTTAMLAAAAGFSYRLPFGGSFQLQYAPDVARAFVRASRSDFAGAAVHNLAGHVVSAPELIAAIEAAAPEAAGTIDHEEEALPFPASVDAESLRLSLGDLEEVPLRVGVADSIGRFRDLLDRGLLAVPVPDGSGP